MGIPWEEALLQVNYWGSRLHLMNSLHMQDWQIRTWSFIRAVKTYYALCSVRVR